MQCTVSQHPTNERDGDVKLGPQTATPAPSSCYVGDLQPYLPDTFGLSGSVWTAMVKLARVFELTGAIKIVS